MTIDCDLTIRCLMQVSEIELPGNVMRPRHAGTVVPWSATTQPGIEITMPANATSCLRTAIGTGDSETTTQRCGTRWARVAMTLLTCGTRWPSNETGRRSPIPLRIRSWGESFWPDAQPRQIASTPDRTVSLRRRLAAQRVRIVGRPGRIALIAARTAARRSGTGMPPRSIVAPEATSATARCWTVTARTATATTQPPIEGRRRSMS